MAAANSPGHLPTSGYNYRSSPVLRCLCPQRNNSPKITTAISFVLRGSHQSLHGYVLLSHRPCRAPATPTGRRREDLCCAFQPGRGHRMWLQSLPLSPPPPLPGPSLPSDSPPLPLPKRSHHRPTVPLTTGFSSDALMPALRHHFWCLAVAWAAQQLRDWALSQQSIRLLPKMVASSASSGVASFASGGLDGAALPLHAGVCVPGSSHTPLQWPVADFLQGCAYESELMKM